MLATSLNEEHVDLVDAGAGKTPAEDDRAEALDIVLVVPEPGREAAYTPVDRDRELDTLVEAAIDDVARNAGGEKARRGPHVHKPSLRLSTSTCDRRSTRSVTCASDVSAEECLARSDPEKRVVTFSARLPCVEVSESRRGSSRQAMLAPHLRCMHPPRSRAPRWGSRSESPSTSHGSPNPEDVRDRRQDVDAPARAASGSLGESDSDTSRTTECS